MFVAGWRPFIGWGCGVILLYAYMLRDLMNWGVRAVGLEIPELPLPPLSDVFDLVIAMLGLASLRTVEKRWGVASQAVATSAPAKK